MKCRRILFQRNLVYLLIRPWFLVVLFHCCCEGCSTCVSVSSLQAVASAGTAVSPVHSPLSPFHRYGPSSIHSSQPKIPPPLDHPHLQSSLALFHTDRQRPPSKLFASSIRNDNQGGHHDDDELFYPFPTLKDDNNTNHRISFNDDEDNNYEQENDPRNVHLNITTSKIDTTVADTAKDTTVSYSDDWVSLFMMNSIKAYKEYISPILLPACRFQPTCSQYGIQAIQDFGPTKGFILIAWRLARCTPLGGRGYDVRLFIVL